MEIRAARPEDAASIARIWNRVIAETASTFTTELKREDGIVALMARQLMLVLSAPDGVAGFATFGPFRAGPGYAETAEHSIYLAETACGAGQGRALMQALEEAARAAGIRQLIAGIGGENRTAIGFHAAIGFEKVGHLPKVGRKFGRVHDLILMQKNL